MSNKCRDVIGYSLVSAYPVLALLKHNVIHFWDWINKLDVKDYFFNKSNSRKLQNFYWQFLVSVYIMKIKVKLIISFRDHWKFKVVSNLKSFKHLNLLKFLKFFVKEYYYLANSVFFEIFTHMIILSFVWSFEQAKNMYTFQEALIRIFISMDSAAQASTGLMQSRFSFRIITATNLANIPTIDLWLLWFFSWNLELNGKQCNTDHPCQDD